jgi:hypothetical protein
MKARQLIENAAYGPETLRVLFLAFDEAWASVAGNFGNHPSAAHTARTKLASIILDIAQEGESDPAKIKNAALQAMALDYREGLE